MTTQQSAWLHDRGEDDEEPLCPDRLTNILMPKSSFPQPVRKMDLTDRLGCAVIILALAVLLWL
jgi:hypothetical protein